MEEDISKRLNKYMALRHSRLGWKLGFGIHGIVYAVQSNLSPAFTAVKFHFNEDPYLRERRAYERLGSTGIFEIAGSHVPQMTSFDDTLFAIEMTIVTTPYVLDFGSAYLDSSLDFPDEIWQEREAHWQEEFGSDWPAAQVILSALQDLGIHMLDPTPSNICFR